MITEKIIKLLSGIDADFQVKQDFIFNQSTADVYAFRKGRNFVFPQRDYFFFHDAEKRNIDIHLAEKLHNDARAFVNSEYKLPKAMRLTVPNITSVIYADKIKDDNLIQLASKWTRSVIGGEIHQIIVADLSSKTFYSQGTHTVRAVVQGVAVNVKFNKIDPQNRAHYLIGQLIQSI
jgi:hypothetical protein